VFVQLWFPTTKQINNNYLSLGDYRQKNVTEDLDEVYKALCAHMDESIIKYCINYDLLADEPINYGELSYTEILNQLLLMPTRSVRLKPDDLTNFPAIVYHHGAQGISDENHIMAEYFASRGYVFISANYHLPYPNTLYGLLPFDLEKLNKHNQSTAKAVINFAKSVSGNNSTFFVGHSWGAQEGWCALHDSSLVDGFVSMETTIEFKTDSNQIKDMWPYVYDAIKVNKNKLTIPVLLFAATEKDEKFHFFEDASSKEMIHASFKEPFAHNSFTSVYMMRYFLTPKIKQPDSEILLSQIKAYRAHLELTYSFFESIRKKEKLNLSNFKSEFYLN